MTSKENKEVPPTLKLIEEVETKHLNNVFHTTRGDDDYVFEEFTFNGEYAMMRHRNPHSNLRSVIDGFYSRTVKHMNCKSIFVEGNILYKKDAPGIKEAIDLLVAVTTMYKLPSCVDKSVSKRTQMLSGTICPTRDVLFRYKGMIFTLYGRYIYGYDTPYVRFTSKEKVNEKYEYTSEEDSETDEDLIEDDYGYLTCKRKPIIKPLIEIDEIILPTISYEEKDPFFNDYNYSFCIVEENTNILLAFSLYR